MGVRELSMTEARTALTGLPEQLTEESDTVAVTRRGKPVLAVLSWTLYESLVETLEVLGDAELMAALRRGLADAEAGRVVPWDEVRGGIDR